MEICPHEPGQLLDFWGKKELLLTNILKKLICTTFRFITLTKNMGHIY